MIVAAGEIRISQNSPLEIRGFSRRILAGLYHNLMTIDSCVLSVDGGKSNDIRNLAVDLPDSMSVISSWSFFGDYSQEFFEIHFQLERIDL